MLSEVSEIRQLQPAVSQPVANSVGHGVSDTFVSSLQSSSSKSAAASTCSLDFSCQKGDFVALLAEKERSMGHCFWIAEAAADIFKPQSDKEAEDKKCGVFYFAPIANCSDYTEFTLEVRKRSASTVASTHYDTIIGRVLNVEKQRGMANRMSISVAERNRLSAIAKQQLKDANKATK